VNFGGTSPVADMEVSLRSPRAALRHTPLNLYYAEPGINETTHTHYVLTAIFQVNLG